MKPCTMICNAAILLIFLAGCTSGDVQIGPDDNGSELSLNQDQVFAVTLESNPTTGYSWQPGFDRQYLEQLGEADFDPDSDLVGAGGAESFRFKALEPGTTTLTLNYMRPWEENVDPEEVFTITVTIRGN